MMNQAPTEANMAIGIEINAGLSLDYQREHGTSGGNVYILNGIDEPVGQGVTGIFGPGFAKEGENLSVC